MPSRPANAQPPRLPRTALPILVFIAGAQLASSGCGSGTPTPAATAGPGEDSPATTAGRAAAAPAEQPAQTAAAATSPTAGAMPEAPPTEAPSAATAGAEPEPTEPAPSADPPPLPAGTKVLHVGDSMADALGKDLKRELEKRGVDNVLKYQEATYIPQWAGYSMGFRSLVKIHDPDLVIVTLGGNEVAMPDPTVRAEPIREIVRIIGDRPCIWVGAPLWGPHSGILDVIRDNCAPCVYVDTNELVPDLERLSDGVHPTIRERKRWAKIMVEWLARARDPEGKRPWDLEPSLSAHGSSASKGSGAGSSSQPGPRTTRDSSSSSTDR